MGSWSDVHMLRWPLLCDHTFISDFKVCMSFGIELARGEMVLCYNLLGNVATMSSHILIYKFAMFSSC